MMQRELTAWDPPYLGMAGLAQELLLPTVPARNIVRLAQVLSPVWVQLVEVAPTPDRRSTILASSSLNAPSNSQIPRNSRT
jgi:hypothetical protein